MAADPDAQVRERAERLIVRERRLTERHPWLYPAAVWAHRGRRRVQWSLDAALHRTTWSTTHATRSLPARVKAHNSLLMRTLEPQEMGLQHGKVTNLRLASARVDGLLIEPGETFSFNRAVGSCTRRKGYVDGMRLDNGEPTPGVGGGICQLANLLHWMMLHSPLTVVERSEHSFDPFPDNGRVLPWGSGCSIVYNYVDLAVRNDTDLTFGLHVGVGERYLEGELRADRMPEHSYKVHARDEEFLRLGQEYFRRNELWRTVVDRRTGRQVGEELVRRNCALVSYVPQGMPVRELAVHGPGAVDPRLAA